MDYGYLAGADAAWRGAVILVGGVCALAVLVGFIGYVWDVVSDGERHPSNDYYGGL